LEGRQRRSNSFVIRIWWEGDDAAPVWRGWVQHAASGSARYFHRIDDLLAFVEECTGALAGPEAVFEEA
jgi:hypothetical protein